MTYLEQIKKAIEGADLTTYCRLPVNPDNLFYCKGLAEEIDSLTISKQYGGLYYEIAGFFNRGRLENVFINKVSSGKGFSYRIDVYEREPGYYEYNISTSNG